MAIGARQIAVNNHRLSGGFSPERLTARSTGTHGSQALRAHRVPYGGVCAWAAYAVVHGISRVWLTRSKQPVAALRLLRYLENPMHAKTLFLTVLLASTRAFAQDAVQTDGDKYKVIFENDCVRVLDYKDLPGQATHQHRHPAFVLYAFTPFKRSITLPDGKILQRQFKGGDVMWSDAQTHIGTNTGETPTHVLLVEMKNNIGVCASR